MINYLTAKNKENMDLSYSGITEKLQGDKESGKKLLIELCQEYIDRKKRIAEQEQLLLKMRSNQYELQNGIDNIMNHLKLKLPLAILLDKKMIVISDSDISLESNVL